MAGLRLRGLAALAALAVALTGCATAALGGTAGAAIGPIPPGTVPASLAGLSVRAQPVSKIVKPLRHTDVTELGFYSLRQHKLIQGTLELAEFNAAAAWRSPAFRAKILAAVSPGIPVTLDVAGQQVQQSAGLKSVVTVWFHDRYLLILTVLDTYPYGRGLLEAALREVRP